jgi:hypothetical protein
VDRRDRVAILAGGHRRFDALGHILVQVAAGQVRPEGRIAEVAIEVEH